MDTHDSAAGAASRPAPGFFRKGLLYAWRATRLVCPVCGTKPIFKPFAQVRNLHDWLTPLDGCPRCGYAYDREPGYFLLATWGINYGVIALVGLFAYILMARADLSFWTMLLIIVIPIPIANLLFARLAKAWFLALDHFFDPHVREGDADGGNGGDQPAPGSLPPGAPSGRDLPEKPVVADDAGRLEPAGPASRR